MEARTRAEAERGEATRLRAEKAKAGGEARGGRAEEEVEGVSGPSRYDRLQPFTGAFRGFSFRQTASSNCRRRRRRRKIADPNLDRAPFPRRSLSLPSRAPAGVRIRRFPGSGIDPLPLPPSFDLAERFGAPGPPPTPRRAEGKDSGCEGFGGITCCGSVGSSLARSNRDRADRRLTLSPWGFRRGERRAGHGGMSTNKDVENPKAEEALVDTGASSWYNALLHQASIYGIAAGYCISASLLSIINKWAVMKFPYPGALTALQYLTSAAVYLSVVG
ncbi:hypothetical protein NL676_039058 [Syzygium grande]|nr:hypothetical protein NL676_039058 [Syzygium grande]